MTKICIMIWNIEIFLHFERFPENRNFSENFIFFWLKIAYSSNVIRHLNLRKSVFSKILVENLRVLDLTLNFLYSQSSSKYTEIDRAIRNDEIWIVTSLFESIYLPKLKLLSKKKCSLRKRVKKHCFRFRKLKKDLFMTLEILAQQIWLFCLWFEYLLFLRIMRNMVHFFVVIAIVLSLALTFSFNVEIIFKFMR